MKDIWTFWGRKFDFNEFSLWLDTCTNKIIMARGLFHTQHIARALIRWWWYLVTGESMECCEHEQQPGPVSVCRCVCGSIMFTDGQIVTSFGHIWHYSDAVQCLDYPGSWLLETVCCYQLIIVTWWGAIITKSTLATLLCSVWPQYSIFIFIHVTATNCAK